MRILLLLLLIAPVMGFSQFKTEEFNEGYMDGYQQGCIDLYGKKCEEINFPINTNLEIDLETIKVAGEEYTKTIKERNYRNGYIEGYQEAYPCYKQNQMSLNQGKSHANKIYKASIKISKSLDKLYKEKKLHKRSIIYLEYKLTQNYLASLLFNCN